MKEIMELPEKETITLSFRRFCPNVIRVPESDIYRVESVTMISEAGEESRIDRMFYYWEANGSAIILDAALISYRTEIVYVTKKPQALGVAYIHW